MYSERSNVSNVSNTETERRETVLVRKGREALTICDSQGKTTRRTSSIELARAVNFGAKGDQGRLVNGRE